MTPSKIFLWFCLSFVGGIFISSFFFISLSVLLAVLISGIFLISVFWPFGKLKENENRKKIIIIGFCLLFLVLGIWRHEVAEMKVASSEIRRYNDTKETITLIGVVSSEPDIREKIQRLVVKIGKDKVLITTWRDAEYRYGDKLRVVGKLETPPIIEDFNYRDFLKKDGIYSQINWPEIEVLERNQGNLIFAQILRFKEKLRKSVYQNLSPPQSAILGAMILGDKRKLPEDLKTKLNVTGLRHITAISGMHVTILTGLLMTFLIGIGLWRQQAFWFSIVLITVFIAMTGFQPSSLRAGIMGGLFLLGQYLGRQSFSSRSIIFASALMLFHNPFLLRLDAGFQLSFLAMMGIIYLMPLFQDWLRFLPEGKAINLRSVLAMTLSAQIFTLPILIYNFGYVSLVAPLTNVLVVPLLPFIMLFGFVFGIVGIVFWPLGQVLSWPAWLLLTYLTKIVEWFSNLSFAFLTAENLHWGWLIISYLFLGLITRWLVGTRKLKFLNY